MKKFYAILITFVTLSTTSGVVLICDFANRDFVGTVGLRYTCNGTVTDVTDNRTISEVRGIHLSGNSNHDVEALYMYDPLGLSSELTFIPVGFSHFFPNLIMHYIRKFPIETIIGNELNEFTNLRNSGVSETKIVSIPGNYFSTNPGIQFVYFHTNENLLHVGDDLLKPLQNLTYAYFVNNLCIDAIALDISQIPALIQQLRDQCPDNFTETTTEFTTTTILEDFCPRGNETERICTLEESNEELRERMKIVEEENENLSLRVEALEEQNEELNERMTDLSIENQQQQESIDNIHEEMNHMMELIQEIANRTCECF